MMFKRQSWLLGLLNVALLVGFSWMPSTQAAETTDNCWVCPIELQPEVFFVQGLAAIGSSANRNFISNAGFVITQDRVVVIDALGSPDLARQLLAEIKKRTSLPVTDVIVTHFHADHIYGLQVFKAAGARIWAHEAGKNYLHSETAQARLAASRVDLAPWVDAQTQLVFADEWLTADRSFNFGGVTFQLMHLGPAHSLEDLVVYLPDAKILFAGDLMFRQRVPFVGQADSRHWQKGLTSLAGLKVDWAIPGHGPASQQFAQDLQQTQIYLQYLRTTMARAVEEGLSFEEAYQLTDWSQFSNLPLFKYANRMNAFNTFLLMEQESLK
jgi:glyoxylase-like metal-dependent hydrolase (beta-lactamase superfamily II)